MFSQSASRRAALFREHARQLAEQAARERHPGRARYTREQAAVFERAAAMLEAPPAPTLWVPRTPKAGGGWRL
jgi:hypothetical protein